MPSAYLTPDRRTEARSSSSLFTELDYARQRAFFAGHPALHATPLRAFPALAGRLGVGQILIKDETDRFGLPAFKGLGIEFAIHTLRSTGALEGTTRLVCASEGNHGRAVARAARRAGLGARVYLSAGVADARACAIAAEGAEIERVPGTYEAAVERAAQEGRAPHTLVISDTSWAGYTAIPREIMLGYTRLMDEAEAAWPTQPDLFIIQAGVGGLLGAVASWVAARSRPPSPETFMEQQPRGRVLCSEPSTAACVQAAARERRLVRLTAPPQTMMGGLRCSEVSAVALEAILDGVDGYVAVEDEWARRAMEVLAHPLGHDPALHVGPSGAAGLAALMAIRESPDLTWVATALGLNAGTRVFLIATEGIQAG